MNEILCHEEVRMGNNGIIRGMNIKFDNLIRSDKTHYNCSRLRKDEIDKLGISQNLNKINYTLYVQAYKFDECKERKGVLYDSEMGSNFIMNGKIKSVMTLMSFEVTTPEKIIKMADLFCNLQNGKHKNLDEDIIQLTFNRTYGNTSFYLAINKKGIAKLSNFLSMYPDITSNYKQYDFSVLTISERSCLVAVVPIEYELFRVVTWIEESYLVKVKIEDLQNPEKVKKLYADILPIVKQYFLSDFTLDNIFYDTRSHKYVIFGIADYIEYNPNEVTINLNSFLNKGLLYYIKGTEHSISFDDYVFWRGNGDVIKKWWEMK